MYVTLSKVDLKPDSTRHSGNCNDSKSLWSNPKRQQSTLCNLIETEVRLLYILLILKYFPKTETPIPKKKVIKGRRKKKGPKRKNQIWDLTEEMAAIENQLSLTLAPGRPDSMGNFVSLADHIHLEDKTSTRHKVARPLRAMQQFIKEHI